MKQLLKVVLFVLASLVMLVAVVGLVGAMVPRRHSAASATVYRQPREAVWTAISDMASQAAWRSDLKGVRRLPDRDGHEVWEQLSDQGNWPLVLTAIEPPARLVATVADSSQGFGGTWTYELAADSAGTRLTITENGFIDQPVFRFLAHFVFGLHGTQQTYLKDLGRHFHESVAPAQVR